MSNQGNSPTSQRVRTTTTEDKTLDSMSRDYEVNESKARREKREARNLRLAELEKEQKALEEQSKKREENLEKQNGYPSSASERRIKAPSIEETSEYGLHRTRHALKQSKEQADTDLDPQQLSRHLNQTKLEKAEIEYDNTSLQYQNSQLKDVLEEYELNLTKYKRDSKKQKSEIEAQKKRLDAAARKQDQFKMIIKQKDDMLESYATQGIKVKSKRSAKGAGDGFDDDDDDDNGKCKSFSSAGEDDGIFEPSSSAASKVKTVRINSRTVDDLAAKFVLNSECQDVNSQVARLLRENEELKAQLTEVRISITSESTKSSSPFMSAHTTKSKSIYLNREEVLSDPLVEMYMHEIQDNAKKEIAQYKLETQTLEQDIAQLKANIIRLEGQVTRYKDSADFYEKAEDELKTQRRALQRENRQQVAQIEELTTTRDHLERRLERMRQHQQRERD